MSSVLAVLLSLFVIPLFIASWRVALAALAGQGFILAYIAYQANPHFAGPEAWISIVDHLMIRGVALPFALYTVLRSRNAHYRIEILPTNIFSWTLSIGAVLLGFSFAALLAEKSEGDRYTIAVVVSGLLLGFLVLSTRTRMFGQLVGVLFIENAIALFEQTEGGHAEPWGIQIGLLAVPALAIPLYSWLLANRTETKTDNSAEILEGPAI